MIFSLRLNFGLLPSTTSPTPVLKLYLPVKIPARVGEHNGFDQALLKTTPRVKSRFTLVKLTVLVP